MNDEKKKGVILDFLEKTTTNIFCVTLIIVAFLVLLISILTLAGVITIGR